MYVRVEKGMYGLPQAGKIVNKLFEKRLKKFGYTQSTITLHFWKHKLRPIIFTPVVDNFGVKYVGEKYMNHLLTALHKFYVADKMKKGTSTAASRWTGITKKKKVHLSVPGYCSKVVQRFRHKGVKLQDQPHQHSIPTYGVVIQYAKLTDKSPILNEEDKIFIQQITGTFLYYSRALDSTMLVALSSIASQQ